MSRARLPVVLLWHMHQPQYRDAASGQYVLPWTTLHAIKDYTDMAAHLESVPGACAVVNFTPLLTEQLDDIAGAIAAHLRQGAPLPDAVLALLGPDPVPSAPPVRLELLRACLRANRPQMIERHAPFLELAALADTLGTPERIGYASDALVRDLAVWYHLAWLGETVRRSHPLVARLTARGRDFDAADRRALLALIGELVAQVVPRFRRLAADGRCELSVTPYAHPIVPLLIDFEAALEALPSIPLPQHRAYPGGLARARWHVEEAIRVHTRTFGSPPAGCWPAEGAVSTATLALLGECGFRWAASGGGVLRASLERASPAAGADPQAYNRPYRIGGGPLHCFFRDDGLSDLVGFTYSTWHGDDAASNLVHELTRMADAHDGSRRHAVLIALDGENAWEHYPYNGYYFLRALYAQLADHPRLELATLSQVLARAPEPAQLPAICAGSWVHGTLATWIGDPAKNRAWDALCAAKASYDRVLAQPLEASRREAASRQLALCEGSDWFWWLGDYNPAEAVEQFDRLYRHQLATLYRTLGLPPAPQLAHPLGIGRGAPEHGGAMRRAAP